MRTFSSSDFLELWERGARLHPLDRDLLILTLADSSPAGNPADWPLGERNRALLGVHGAWFGSRLHGWCSCPDCSQRVEFDLDTAQLMAPDVRDQPRPRTIAVGDKSFRLPTSRDIAAVLATQGLNSAVAFLLKQCQIEGDTASLTARQMEEIGEQMALADPMAEIRLTLRCPACNRAWDGELDIGSFIWAELHSRAGRLLWQVHRLASAYGWSESQILSLSAARRAAYLQMVQT